MKFVLLRLVGGFFIFQALSALAIVHYVDLNSTNPEPPYLSWSAAATNIQDAIDAATNGDMVLVTNGIYDVGQVTAGGGPYSPVPNRVAITSAITVQSGRRPLGDHN
jgi:hypothetical protein